MVLFFVMKSRIYAWSIKITRAILPWRLGAKHRSDVHFRGWFSTTIHGRKIEPFNFNTELETSLFWTKSIAEVETSLLCFTELAKISTTILGVGANTGIFVVAASSVNKNATTFAIEPSYTNFMGLKANGTRNGLPVSCLNLAVTSENKLGKL